MQINFKINSETVEVEVEPDHDRDLDHESRV